MVAPKMSQGLPESASRGPEEVRPRGAPILDERDQTLRLTKS